MFGHSVKYLTPGAFGLHPLPRRQPSSTPSSSPIFVGGRSHGQSPILLLHMTEYTVAIVEIFLGTWQVQKFWRYGFVISAHLTTILPIIPLVSWTAHAYLYVPATLKVWEKVAPGLMKPESNVSAPAGLPTSASFIAIDGSVVA